MIGNIMTPGSRSHLLHEACMGLKHENIFIARQLARWDNGELESKVKMFLLCMGEGRDSIIQREDAEGLNGRAGSSLASSL